MIRKVKVQTFSSCLRKKLFRERADQPSIIYETPPSPPTSPESYPPQQIDLVTIPEPVDFLLVIAHFNVSTPVTEFPKAITTFSVEISTRLPLHVMS
jgi:hypothetical protein